MPKMIRRMRLTILTSISPLLMEKLLIQSDIRKKLPNLPRDNAENSFQTQSGRQFEVEKFEFKPKFPFKLLMKPYSRMTRKS